MWLKHDAWSGNITGREPLQAYIWDTPPTGGLSVIPSSLPIPAMQFKLLSTLAFVGATLASPMLEGRQSTPFCAEAGRFGRIELSKTDIAPGDVSLLNS